MRNQKLLGHVCLSIAGLIGPGLCGCGLPPGYVRSAVWGELLYLSSMVPIEAGLEDPSLTAEEREKLAFVIRARDYAEQVVGLQAGNNYQQFVNLHGEPLAWSLNASRKDAFEPYVRHIPVIGPLPYLGFLDLDEARAEQDRLVTKGYDTFLYEIDTYALSFLPDPVTSRVLRRSWHSLADVVMHELLHNTVFHPRDTTFNESLAVWVGRTAGMEFLQADFGPDDPRIEQAMGSYEDQDRFNAFLQGLVADLNVLYDRSLPSRAKIAAREFILQAARRRFATEVWPLMNDPARYEQYADFPFNNAFLVVNVRYNSGLDVFEGICEMTGRDWNQSLALFIEAANEDEPIEFLQGMLAGEG